MAKALSGFATTSIDPRLISEIRALRCRVRDLEAELDRYRAENDALAAHSLERFDEAAEMSTALGTVVLDDREPALT